ncbi:MAG TPA: hypothetical protein VI357_00395 [Mycobacteriales bacterium]
MSETPRDQRGLWSEVNARIEELGEVLRGHLSPDAARTPSDPTAPGDRPAADRPAPGSAGSDAAPPSGGTSGAGGGDAWAEATRSTEGRPDWARPTGPAGAPSPEGSAASGSAPVQGGGTSDPAAPSAAAGGPGGTAPGAGDPGAAGAAGAGGSDAGSAGDAGAAGGRGRGAGGPAGSARWVGSWRWGNSEWHTDSARPGWSGRARNNGPDWDSARESVREMRESAQRFAAQAADAARDPEVRDSAQRAVRSLGDAIATTAQDLATEIRERMRSPRWSDTTKPRPTERPPVAKVDDDPPTP